MEWDDPVPHRLDRIPKSARREPIQSDDDAPIMAIIVLFVVVAFIAITVFVVAILALVPQSQGRELYPGQYAQVDPVVRQWFRDQKVPGTDRSCCSESDGVYAEEDIRAGHYWTRFVARQYKDGAEPLEIQSEWMQVPDEAVIHDPNRHGAPVVWWGWQNGLFIRCFAPGSGA